MTRDTRVTMHKGTAAVIAIVLVLAGAGASYLVVQRRAGTTAPVDRTAGPIQTAAPTSDAVPSPAATVAADAPWADVVVPLAAHAVERAGIALAPVASGTSAGGLRLPGVVEPNAYRQVAVTPLVAGRVTRVSVELGASVRRGQTLAQIHSPELAEAQTRYVSAHAMLDAHDRELQRTEKLVEIGAASRQELERLHAEHAAQTAAVASARAQLELLGLPAGMIDALRSGSAPDATASVRAPADGVIIQRAANAGLNVDPATTLFTVVDLSTVWIIADVYERDFSRVRVGSEAIVTTTAYPDLAVRGRVSYIDPRVNPDARTAKVRVEVPNPRGELRLGMFADVVVTGTRGAAVAVVPRSAVQHVGNRTVVYLVHPEQAGHFIEREVRLGGASHETVEVTSGVQPGDTVVTEGSFFVRAERERLGLRPPGTDGMTAAAPAGSAGAQTAVQTARIVVTEKGFEPAKIPLRAGSPVRLTFIRTTDKTCATEVVFPALQITRALPLNEPVEIAFTPAQSGQVAFACGMNMLRGAVVVQ